MSESPFYFVASDYFGTGEGMTQALLITYAYPDRERDYEVEPNYDLETGTFYPGVLKYPKEQVAILQFADLFGHWIAIGAEAYSQEAFFKKYANMIPENVTRMITDPERKLPGNFKWYSEFHVNFS